MSAVPHARIHSRASRLAKLLRLVLCTQSRSGAGARLCRRPAAATFKCQETLKCPYASPTDYLLRLAFSTVALRTSAALATCCPERDSVSPIEMRSFRPLKCISTRPGWRSCCDGASHTVAIRQWNAAVSQTSRSHVRVPRGFEAPLRVTD
jgi:hypothetical protein